MRFRSIALSLFLICAMSSVPALAQNHFSFSSDFMKAGKPAPQACIEAGAAFVKLLSAYPHPASGWNFVVVCDEPTWQHVMRHTELATDPGEQYGETDFDHNLVIIRGWKLTHPDMGVSPAHIVSHELAHVMLHSSDEAKVDRQAQLWMADRGAGTTDAMLAPVQRTK
jgi:hypothetical protein